MIENAEDQDKFARFRNKEEICPLHGAFTSYNFLGAIWSKCPACVKAEDEARHNQAQQDRKREAAAAEARYWESAFTAANIPTGCREKTLESYVAKTKSQRDALDFAIAYANNFEEVLTQGRGAIFLGTPGTGKTHLAIGVALHILERRKTAYYSTVMRAFRRIKSTWGNKSEETEGQAVAAMTLPSLLILDEVGIQFGSEFEKNIMFDVLNERYDERRPTILVSNLNLEGTSRFLGDRIMERLEECGGKTVIFNWESHRKKDRKP